MLTALRGRLKVSSEAWHQSQGGEDSNPALPVHYLGPLQVTQPLSASVSVSVKTRGPAHLVGLL